MADDSDKSKPAQKDQEEAPQKAYRRGKLLTLADKLKNPLIQTEDNFIFAVFHYEDGSVEYNACRTTDPTEGYVTFGLKNDLDPFKFIQVAGEDGKVKVIVNEDQSGATLQTTLDDGKVLSWNMMKLDKVDALSVVTSVLWRFDVDGRRERAMKAAKAKLGRLFSMLGALGGGMRPPPISLFSAFGASGGPSISVEEEDDAESDDVE